MANRTAEGECLTGINDRRFDAGGASAFRPRLRGSARAMARQFSGLSMFLTFLGGSSFPRNQTLAKRHSHRSRQIEVPNFSHLGGTKLSVAICFSELKEPAGWGTGGFMERIQGFEFTEGPNFGGAAWFLESSLFHTHFDMHLRCQSVSPYF